MFASTYNKQKLFFYLYGLAGVFCVLAAFYFKEKALAVVPLTLVVMVWGIINFKSLYFFLLALIPLSIEVDVANGLGTDLPTEPLMIVFMCLALFYGITNLKKVDFSIFKNPLIILLILHVFWMFISTLFSTVPLFSVKFLLAKLWYISAFLIVTLIVVKNEKDLKTAFWCIFIPLVFTIFIALFRHALTGFDFTMINKSLYPFYRNHVNYAALLAVFLPFVFYATTWYKKFSFKYNVLILSILLFIVATYFSYTRASYLALIAMFGAYFIFKLKLAKYAVVFGVVLFIFIGIAISSQNKYLEFSPNTSTVSQEDLGSLMTSTFKARDVSSMERIYRWLAAVEMIKEKPIVGFGPNGFVENYKNFTFLKFRTWISTNEERSGVHNYFLMTATEQGLVGLALFLSLIFTIFIWGENLYHKTVKYKSLTMAVLVSFVAILINLFFSDMIEVDKTGSFFFLNIALLVFVSRKLENSEKHDTSINNGR
ncbi:MAG: O-antigen ligase family protein [Bacteroidetes bacterium]|nr:O-antigen ligase family protein [Bacteroidota bacterium]MCB9227947.1 O-antigen ligase family protein [Chitinophagales bacterium]